MTGPNNDEVDHGRPDGGDAPSVRLRAALGRFERPLTLYAMRIVGDADRARDVVQETFARLLRAARDEPGSRDQGGPRAGAPGDDDDVSTNGHLAQWLYTVCRNRALDVRRKERRMTRLTDLPFGTPTATPSDTGPDADAFPGPAADPAADVERRDATSHVLRLLDRLPGNQQECLRLKFQHGLSYREIAAVTHLSESNVGFLIHTGLKRLREQLTGG
jgi:RNA polymerase sigma factor (sigma-70 family)